jgi:hypothetical protein
VSRCVPAEGAILASISICVSDISKTVGSSKSDADVRVKLMADGGRLSEMVGSDGTCDSLDGKEERKSICLAVMPDSKDCISRRWRGAGKRSIVDFEEGELNVMPDPNG